MTRSFLSRQYPAVAILLLVLASLPGGCAHNELTTQGAPPPSSPPPSTPAITDAPDPDAKQPEHTPSIPNTFVTVFPHVRVNATTKSVEIDAQVVLESRAANAPKQYLEVIACTPDTRPHEALVVIDAKPSHVHAALLMAGMQPGSPGRWELSDNRLHGIPPTGDPVSVKMIYTTPEGMTVECPASDWIVNAKTGKTMKQSIPNASWVFAGSVFKTADGREKYLADTDGTVVGLHTFGAEVIACTTVMNPDASTEEPVWIMNGKLAPSAGTAVVVRITRQ